MIDVAIIGGGPAGLSAALTLKANRKSLVWIAGSGISEKVRRAPMIHNYPGLPAVSGADFAAILDRHAEQAEISMERKMVTGIYPMGDFFAVATPSDFYEAKVVILATGVESVKPISGEQEFLGRGVSYCATCDGMLYAGKKIVVVSTSQDFEHEVRYLADLAEVVFVPLYKNPSDFGEKVQILRAMPTAIRGSAAVEEVAFSDGTVCAVDGVFLLKSAISPSNLLAGIEVADGHITVDRGMRTSVSGVFAAGDCTGRPYQYAKAVGEGNVAAHSAIEWLAKQN